MSDTTTTTLPNDATPPAGKKRLGPVVGLVIAAVMVFAFGVSVGGAGKTTTAIGPAPTVTVTAPAPVPPPPPGPASTITKAGVYVVGTDVAAGTYKTTEGGGYFAILQDATAPTDDVDNILTNDNPRGQAFATLKPGQGFKTTGDMTWVKVG